MEPNPRRRTLPVIALLASLAFTAGATDCTYRGRDFGGRTPDQVVQGTVSGFGGLRVGSVEYTTATVDVTLDGARAAESDLRVGHVAALVGRVDADGTGGRADTVRVETALVGTVTAIDAVRGVLTVLGQSVQLGADTSVGVDLAGPLTDAFAVGDRLAIHGHPDSASGLRATRIERVAATRALRVAGRVATLDPAARVFAIRGTNVDYGNAGTVDAGLRAGGWAVATGAVTAADGTLRATRIEVREELPAVDERDTGEVEGLVTRRASAADFEVGGRAIVTDPGTVWAEGTADDLQLDRRVVASGRYDASGRLVASRVEYRRAADARVLAPIDAFDGTAFTAGGIRWVTNARTRWDDRGPLALRAFRHADLRLGDWVEVRGAEDAAARTATALVVERRGAPLGARIELQGLVARLANPTLEVLDTAVTTSGAEFRDRSGAPLTRTQFYAQAANAVVRVRGTYAGITLVADSVALRP